MTNPESDHVERLDGEATRLMLASTEQVSAAVAPLVTYAARANAEFVSLAARRARAYLDIPRNLSACRGPQDLFSLQMRFWQTAAQDYSAYAQRLTDALGGRGGSASTESGKRAERDLLPLTSAFGFPMWPLPVESTGSRDQKDRAA